MAAKYGLGKGLDALLSGTSADETRPENAPQGEVRIPLEKLKANPNQPRKVFDEESLQELAASIREHGIIQPIIVEETPDGTYIIVAGERRSRAARLAGLREVPAIIRNYSDERRLEVALIENVQRSDLNPVEEAQAYKRLMELTGLSQDEVAARVGKNRSTVANALRLLKLPDDMQHALAAQQMTSGHARAILSVVNPADQRVLFGKIIADAISVREAEKFAQELNGGIRAADKPKRTDKLHEKAPELLAMEQQFIDILGTKVSISGGLKRGSIHIDYYSMEDLDRIYAILASKETQ
ncbi:ParB/RepB/Spo0J family partition protein [Gracilinema caldarium]|uniref:ParB-like partition protein n=1 Tax=Gracilinema caldarium (strain ATCC 51460 / DSM 7334 / H1) TaxID=744872 RepID=F8F2A2_GRAC1|nr:ParB/RepB/Spo0J family partition protein [Gracilinema caldarium]AEJ20884.1 parB-like partition protein [Gracilinema caldarium DSM 7334]